MQNSIRQAPPTQNKNQCACAVVAACIQSTRNAQMVVVQNEIQLIQPKDILQWGIHPVHHTAYISLPRVIWNIDRRRWWPNILRILNTRWGRFKAECVFAREEWSGLLPHLATNVCHDGTRAISWHAKRFSYYFLRGGEKHVHSCAAYNLTLKDLSVLDPRSDKGRFGVLLNVDQSPRNQVIN